MVTHLLPRKKYVEHKFHKLIALKDETDYYSSKITKRRDSKTRQEEVKSVAMLPPGEIHNNLLKNKRGEGGLAANMSEFNNYVCLPEWVWSRIVAIYHGGPPIERIFPQIYSNTVIRVKLNSSAKFAPHSARKLSSKEDKRVS